MPNRREGKTMHYEFRLAAICCAFLLVALGDVAQHEKSGAGEYIKSIPTMRERVEIAERWWQQKREVVLPMVMQEQGIDMWIIRADEADKYYNNEGPLYSSLAPADLRGMIYESEWSNYAGDYSRPMPAFLMFYDTGDGIEYVEPRDYEHIAELVEERDPSTIAIGQFNNGPMLEVFGEEYASRTVDSQTVGMRWYETVTPEMLDTYRHVVGVANDIIAEQFSNGTIIPNVTTTDDLNWSFRHRLLELGIEHENHPSISVQRNVENIARYDDPQEHVTGARTRNDIDVVIRRGDVLRVDTDVFMFGLVTDTHQYAYVLQRGETDVLQELQEALSLAHRIQDQFAQEFQVGRTGKEIVAASESLTLPSNVQEATNDFHPPPKFIRRFQFDGWMLSTKTAVVGMASSPVYVPTSIISDDYTLHYNTTYAFEPHIDVVVPGWGDLGLELGAGQIVAFTEDGFEYLNRQTEWHVIR